MIVLLTKITFMTAYLFFTDL